MIEKKINEYYQKKIRNNEICEFFLNNIPFEIKLDLISNNKRKMLGLPLRRGARSSKYKRFRKFSDILFLWIEVIIAPMQLLSYQKEIIKNMVDVKDYNIGMPNILKIKPSQSARGLRAKCHVLDDAMPVIERCREEKK